MAKEDFEKLGFNPQGESTAKVVEDSAPRKERKGFVAGVGLRGTKATAKQRCRF